MIPHKEFLLPNEQSLVSQYSLLMADSMRCFTHISAGDRLRLTTDMMEGLVSALKNGLLTTEDIEAAMLTSSWQVANGQLGKRIDQRKEDLRQEIWALTGIDPAQPG